MATLPAFIKSNDEAGPEPEVGMRKRARAAHDPYELRALPNETLCLFHKTIDNSRLVRAVDLKSLGACWHALGAAGLLGVLMVTAFAPTVASTVAGYRLEALKVEERRLLEERRGLDLQEAELLSQDRLDQLARQNNLVAPAPGQVHHLDSKAEGTVALAQ
jgi:hypothetical protein